MSSECLMQYKIPLATNGKNGSDVVAFKSPLSENADKCPPPSPASKISPAPPRKRKAIPSEPLENTVKIKKPDPPEPAEFIGRDESYPDELKTLITTSSCGLCNVKIISIQNSRDHYVSKAHDRNLTKWLTANYTNKGLTAPQVKRFHKEALKGPEAYHCEICDLKLTSVLHANQHFAGRKHKLAASGGSKPKGAGYYDDDGKWIRTGTKANPKVPDDGRFGIGQAFVNTSEAVDDKLYCQICKVKVTSEDQMQMHLKGTKHQKKSGSKSGETLQANTDGNLITFLPVPTDNKLDENPEYSMYRTPTGSSYYCPTCDVTMQHVKILSDHLKGKKHLKQVGESKAKTKTA